MKVVIMGCGRVGAELAALLDREGQQVTILDIDPDAFGQLPADFKGSCVVGNGIDQDVLQRLAPAQALPARAVSALRAEAGRGQVADPGHPEEGVDLRPQGGPQPGDLTSPRASKADLAL